MFQAFLTERRYRPEMMDQPALDIDLHRQALSGLGRLNQVSGVCRQLWKPMRRYSQAHGAPVLRVLDIASGGGDVALGLWRRAQRSGIELRILGLDASSTACQYATERCQPAAGSIAFRQADVTRDKLPTGFDVVTCSLFLHHLSRACAAELLANMGAAGRTLIVNDLRRCAAGYALAQLACHLLTTSPVVGSDGPQSVANAFSLAELRGLSAAAGLVGATVRATWPCRLMLIR